jgi:hypothetical protein
VRTFQMGIVEVLFVSSNDLRALREAAMRRELVYSVGILGALFAWSSNVAAQPLDGYARFPPAQPYPPNYHLPPPSYVPLPSYVPALSYSVPANLYALHPYRGSPYDAYYSAPAQGYMPPPAAESVPPIVVLIPLRPRSCGKYRYWTGEYCADARYERPYLGSRW